MFLKNRSSSPPLFQHGKASIGDLIYRYISSDQLYPECLLDWLDLSF
ncbi:hypothetical protein POPTR_002G068366v4 [Populus trichocarpa]|uniref:Uncharacterized protein n=1 Tax=Populus trichocarpa TaxID=3694 RepID=A0ACC0TCZ6_POPTR|nr:hypothetical protein POPTR_002G068366v4 [Populus trichocarpa]